MTRVNQLRCADAAELSADPLEASAPPVDYWLLVEHAGPWGRRAIADSRLDPAAASALARWTEANRARVALIRRPRAAKRRPGLPRQWCRVDSRAGRESVRWGSFSDERELIDVLADPAAGWPSTEPVYLVCTHGRHDTCCAVRGRPVAAALAEVYPQRTWECSHIGGDRFAANVVLLPHGLYYGQVVPAVAVDIAQHYDAGLVHLRLLRGRSSLTAAEQAAQHHARLALDDDRVDALPVLSCEQAGVDVWRVRLDGPNGVALTVTVRARMVDAGRPLTCVATIPGRFRVFDLVELR